MHRAKHPRFRFLQSASRTAGMMAGAAGICGAVGLAIGARSFVGQDLAIRELSLLDHEGNERARLAVVNDSPLLTFMDSDGEVTLGIGISTGREDSAIPMGRPILYLGPYGHPAITLGLTGSGRKELQPALILTQPEAYRIAMHAFEDAATVGIFKYDSASVWEAMPQVLISAGQGHPPTIQMWDAQGGPISPTEASTQEATAKEDKVVRWSIARTQDVLDSIRQIPTQGAYGINADCHGRGVTDETVAALCKAPNLRSLTLRGCPQVTGLGVASIAKSATLTTLWIVNCPNAVSGHLRELESNQSVRTLGLISMPLAAEALHSMAKMKSLVDLSLAESSGVNDDMLADLCGLGDIRRIDLRGIAGLSSVAIERLRECLADAEVLY